MIKVEWLCSRDLNNMYVHSEMVDWRMKALLDRYGWFFDDDYFYWYPRGRVDIVKRRPLVLWPSKSTPAEKHKLRG